MHASVTGQLLGEAADGLELGAGQTLGCLRADEVGTPNGAVQHGATGEGRHRLPAIEHNVGKMVGGVTRSVQRTDHQRADGKLVTVTSTEMFIGDIVGAGQHIGRSGPPGQLQAAAHIVVVQMGLEHVAEVQAPLGQHCLDPIDVALGIDSCGREAVYEQVAAITQRRRVNSDDLHG